MNTKFTLRDVMMIVGAALAIAGYLYSIEHRVTVLEVAQKYSHGDLSPYLERK